MWLFFCIFPTFPNTKCSTIHPPPWLPAAQHISGASLNFPSCIRTSAKLFTAMSVARCSGPSCRSRASSSRRRSGSASAKAPRASSTYASLGGGAPREPKSFHGFRGERVFDFVVSWIQISGSKYFLSSRYRLYLLMLFDAVWCYLMLVVNTVAYCNLQLSLCSFVASLDANLWWQDNIVLDSTNLTNTCLLMCWSLWRDWGPHRLSAKSANSCSGPNLSAVASARHRSLGPWWCLSHGCAYHMAMRWSTMSPAWKTKQFQENGQVRKMAKVWESFQLQSEAPWLLGCNRWPLLQMRDLQPDVFTREGGGAGFLNWQTCVLHGVGRFKSTYNIVNRHSIAEYSW